MLNKTLFLIKKIIRLGDNHFFLYRYSEGVSIANQGQEVCCLQNYHMEKRPARNRMQPPDLRIGKKQYSIYIFLVWVHINLFLTFLPKRTLGIIFTSQRTREINWGTVGGMPHTLAVSGKKGRMPPLQWWSHKMPPLLTAKKIIDIMLLALPSVNGIIQAPSDRWAISHGSRNP